MVNYQNGLIYKIVCNDLRVKETYYGSTTNFNQRVKQHKRTCNNNCKQSNNLKYKFIRANGGWDNWKVILIKEFPCNSKRELEREERYEMEKDDNRLNVSLPTRTQKEYREANIEELKEKNKEYRQKNKERITEQRKEYYENNKERILEGKKEYQQKNKEKISERMKIYDEKNKEKIKEKKSQKVTCECGLVLTKGCLPRHKKSQKHVNLLKLIENK